MIAFAVMTLAPPAFPPPLDVMAILILRIPGESSVSFFQAFHFGSKICGKLSLVAHPAFPPM